MSFDPEPLEGARLPRTHLHPLRVALIVTVIVTALSYGAPLDYAATVVGGAFLAAVGWLVARHDIPTIRHFGVSLGGVVEPGPIDAKRVARDASKALAWALGLAVAIFVPFVIGFRIYWHVQQGFHFRPPASMFDEVLGQIVVIALPEEAFYRGYLMTALDDAWGTPWTVAKAKLGWGWIASSALFAAGHLLTEPNAQRLAVFFPALLFGWLRARTRGVGAPVLFHALCNIMAGTLTRGYGLTT
ncbi:MAG TPA: MrtC family glutamic-type intramembrane protease [Polyangiaceae bacterium]|nr:MrtC family glutamic-type intramembrane protease [Polyangiaceae bacterium]